MGIILAEENMRILSQNPLKFLAQWESGNSIRRPGRSPLGPKWNVIQVGVMTLYKNNCISSIHT